MAKVEIIRPEKRSKMSYVRALKEKHWIAIILVVCALILWFPIPIQSKESVVALILVAIAIYHLFKN